MRIKPVLAAVVVLTVAVIGAADPAAAHGRPDRPHPGPVNYAPDHFTHPGVLVSQAQLSFIRAKVRAGAEPWKSAYAQMMASGYASLSRVPAPRPVVECGPTSNPNLGCTDERQDAIAAYTDALAWSITRNQAYAKKSIELMDAWSAVLTGHTDANAPLQSAWSASVWTRAAEIIRYSYRWPGARRFGRMLDTAYLPLTITGRTGAGNWELTMMEASIGIAVFTDDKKTYNTAVGIYLSRVPAYVYLASDGPLPKVPPASGLTDPAAIATFWNNTTTYVTGLSQETCRDFVHTGYGLASMADVAETSRIQGRSLYPLVGKRLEAGLEFQTAYMNGAPIPTWLCGGKLTLNLGPIATVGYNELHFREHKQLPNTKAYLQRTAPEATNNLFVAWQTLTNANNPY